MGMIGSPNIRARQIIEQPATRELVPLVEGESFRWMQHHYPDAIARWNYHPEIEIHLIRRGSGSYLIGDQIGGFGPGHVAIVGSEVPHDWMSDLEPGEVLEYRDAVIQVLPSWLESCIDAVPELHDVRTLISEARRGIIYTGTTAKDAAVAIEAVGVTEGTTRMAHFFTLLDIFVHAPEGDRHHVAHELYASSTSSSGRAAVDAGLAYVVENLSGDIRMSEAARLALMSEPTFSKYFKKASGMTFSDMVRRLRIANACRLLDRTESSVSDISLAVGYRNLANFNRQFRAETGCTPSQYRQLDVAQRPRIGLAGQAVAGPREESGGVPIA